MKVYAIAESVDKFGKTNGYRLYISDIDMIYNASIEDLYTLLNNNCKIENLSITLDGIKYSKYWPFEIEKLYNFDLNNIYKQGAKFVFIRPAVNDVFSIVAYTGVTSDVARPSFEDDIRKNLITNCKTREINGRLKYSYIGTDEVSTDIQFSTAIAEQYNKYITKNALLGNNISMDYKIYGHEVLLKKIRSTNKTFIVPNFITGIASYVERYESNEIKTLILNEGLKYIATQAFQNIDTLGMNVPSTVQLIGKNAFSTELSKRISTGVLKLSNRNTIIDIEE